MSNLTQEEIEAMLRGETIGGSEEQSDQAEAAETAGDSVNSESGEADASDTAQDAAAGDGHEWFDPGMANNERLEALDVSDQFLSSMEKDTLGEIGNICMGTSATTMYTLLGHKVEITTPKVRVFRTEQVLEGYRSPFVIVDVEYTSGVIGKNLLILRDYDAAVITDLLMGGEGDVDEHSFEINEIHLSAMSEIMNQMIGSSATSLSDMLGRLVDISPPTASLSEEQIDMMHLLNNEEYVVCIAFDMQIEGLLRTNLMQIMTLEVAHELVDALTGNGASEEPAEAPAPAPAAPAPAAAAPAPAPAAAAPMPAMDSMAAAAPMPAMDAMAAAAPMPAMDPAAQQMMQQQMAYQQQMYQQQMQQMQQQMQQMMQQQAAYAQGGAVVQPQQVGVSPMTYQSFGGDPGFAGARDIDLVSDIPLQVSVELGRTKKNVDDVLQFGVGSIVVLDRLAGELVDVIVNGKLIARGEVVVIDENYGVRITDIIKRKNLSELYNNA